MNTVESGNREERRREGEPDEDGSHDHRDHVFPGPREGHPRVERAAGDEERKLERERDVDLVPEPEAQLRRLGIEPERQIGRVDGQIEQEIERERRRRRPAPRRRALASPSPWSR